MRIMVTTGVVRDGMTSLTGNTFWEYSFHNGSRFERPAT
jgi:hypothetical protein